MVAALRLALREEAVDCDDLSRGGDERGVCHGYGLEVRACKCAGVVAVISSCCDHGCHWCVGCGGCYLIRGSTALCLITSIGVAHLAGRTTDLAVVTTWVIASFFEQRAQAMFDIRRSFAKLGYQTSRGFLCESDEKSRDERG